MVALAYAEPCAYHAACLSGLQGGGSGGGEGEKLRVQLAEVVRENHILKRAVAIQNSRMQEVVGREAAAAQLQEAVRQLQQKCHALEVQNYSLAMHLRQATDGSDPLKALKNPDVF